MRPRLLMLSLVVVLVVPSFQTQFSLAADFLRSGSGASSVSAFCSTRSGAHPLVRRWVRYSCSLPNARIVAVMMMLFGIDAACRC